MLVAVKTADCIPILMVDGRTHAVAAVHAGWRGTAKNIVAQAIAEMEQKFYSRAEDVHVAIGPGIGKCCYEVGPEVVSNFASMFLTGEFRVSDVFGSSRSNRGDSSSLCGDTRPNLWPESAMCNEFHSYRRAKNERRMFSVVGIR